MSLLQHLIYSNSVFFWTSTVIPSVTEMTIVELIVHDPLTRTYFVQCLLLLHLFERPKYRLFISKLYIKDKYYYLIVLRTHKKTSMILPVIVIWFFIFFGRGWGYMFSFKIFHNFYFFYQFYFSLISYRTQCIYICTFIHTDYDYIEFAHS